MRQNRIRSNWADGRPVVNGWLGIDCPFTAEIMAEQGYDALTIDLQHGPIGFAGAVAMLQAMRASAVAALVRVPRLDPAALMRVLDAGADGVICPMIDTPAQAEQLVASVRYPPLGIRSFGPMRAALAAGPAYGEGADAAVLCFAMIETAAGVENLDAIAATPGLDGLYVGPADLTLALTGRRLPAGFDREEEEMVRVIRHILDRAHAAGIRAGLHTGSAAYALRAVEWGFDLVTISSDVRLLAGAARASVDAFRKGSKVDPSG